MKPYKTLGLCGEDCQPYKPVYKIGPVISRGKNFKKKMNHADYVDKSGDCNNASVSPVDDHAMFFFNFGIGYILYRKHHESPVVISVHLL